MRFREAKEAGLDHLAASYVGTKYLNQHNLHFTNGIDLKKKQTASSTGRLVTFICTVHYT